jgi:drug/metabolite transporter superfamily protein YnfA
LLVAEDIDMLFPHRIVWGISGASLIVMASLLTLAAPESSNRLVNAISGSRIAKCATGLDSAILPKRPDSGPEEAFGSSVSMSGCTIVTGAPVFDGGAGRAYIFEGDGRSCRQVAELDTPPKATSGGFGSALSFGASVAVAGQTIVVGAPGTVAQPGRAFVYAEGKSGWQEVAQLSSPDDRPGDNFGAAVAVYGRTIVVGAPLSGSGAGRAYVFVEAAAGGWRQAAELAEPGAAANDRFGESVDLWNDTVIIGSVPEYQPGRIYVFTAASGWRHPVELKDPVNGRFDLFGSTIAISGNNVVVGAPVAFGTGRAFIFTRNTAGWQLAAELGSSVSKSGNGFGKSVAISDKTIAIGDVSSGQGAAYVYLQTANRWTRAARLAYGALNNGFGSSLAVVGQYAVVGAPNQSADDGSIYAFSLANL